MLLVSSCPAHVEGSSISELLERGIARCSKFTLSDSGDSSGMDAEITEYMNKMSHSQRSAKSQRERRRKYEDEEYEVHPKSDTERTYHGELSKYYRMSKGCEERTMICSENEQRAKFAKKQQIIKDCP